MMCLPLQYIYDNPSDLLAAMGRKIGGEVFEKVVVVDAIIVLCGAVLTSYVGVSNLMRRLASDKVLPAFLGERNRRGSPYIAIIFFLLLCISLFTAVFDPKNPTGINNVGNVYAMSFLCVLTAFTYAAVMLKLFRPQMARLVISKWWEIWMSVVAVLTGLAGNLVLNPPIFVVFLEYLAGFLALISFMFLRVDILSYFIWMVSMTMTRSFMMNFMMTTMMMTMTILVQMRKLNMDDAKAEAAAKLDDAIRNACAAQAEFDELAGLVALTEEEEIQHIRVAHLPQRSSFSAIGHHEGDGGGGASGQSPVTVSSSRLESVLGNVRRRFSFASVNSQAPTSGARRVRRNNSIEELQAAMEHRVMGMVLRACMHSLDSIVSSPVVYLAKYPDPISLLSAIEYIMTNELTNNLLVVHFVDDRAVMKAHQQYLSAQRTQHAAAPAACNGHNHGHHDGSGISERGLERQGNTFLLRTFMYADQAHTADESFDFSAVHVPQRQDTSSFLSETFELGPCLDHLSATVKQMLQTVALLDTFM